MVASRRYVEHGIVELVLSRRHDGSASDLVETIEDVVTSKLGLALSAFGTIVWGWGTYLGWWTFGILAIWAILALRDALRDRRH